MKVRLLGVRELDFTANDNSKIKGSQLFTSYPEEGVVGEMTDKFFVREGFDLPPLKPGEILEISFNKKGKPESVKSVNRQVN